jgi:hypothetical protein
MDRREVLKLTAPTEKGRRVEKTAATERVIVGAAEVKIWCNPLPGGDGCSYRVRVCAANDWRNTYLDGECLGDVIRAARRARHKIRRHRCREIWARLTR